MNEQHPLKIKRKEFIKPVVEALILNQGSSIRDTIILISSRLNLSTRSVSSFIKKLYRRGFLIISHGRYALTLEGNLYLLHLLANDLDLRGEENE